MCRYSLLFSSELAPAPGVGERGPVMFACKKKMGEGDGVCVRWVEGGR